MSGETEWERETEYGEKEIWSMIWSKIDRVKIISIQY